RRLILLDRHQVAVTAHHVVVLTDPHMVIVLGTMIEMPDHIAALALILLGDGPGARERIVDRGDLVDQHVLVRLVERDTLLDDRFTIIVQLDAARLERARPLEAAALHLQHVVAAISVLIDPFADGIAGEGRLDLLRPGPPVGIDAARIGVVGEDVGRVRHDDDFHREDDAHHARHAGRDAFAKRIRALPAGALVGEISFITGLIFRRERRLLCGPYALALIPLDADAGRPAPLAH